MLLETSWAGWAVYSKEDSSLWRPLILWSSDFGFNFYYDCWISLCEEDMTFLEKGLPFLGMKKADRNRYWSGYLPSGLMLAVSSLVVNFSWEIIVDNGNKVCRITVVG